MSTTVSRCSSTNNYLKVATKTDEALITAHNSTSRSVFRTELEIIFFDDRDEVSTRRLITEARKLARDIGGKASVYRKLEAYPELPWTVTGRKR